MSQISAKDVMALRDRTSLPMMDCKAALSEAKGDMEKAIQILRERNKGVSVKREGRETAEGRIATFIDPAAQVGAIVELRCESPMVVKADAFIALGKEIAEHVAAKNPATVAELLPQPFQGDVSKSVQDRINEAIGLIRENMKVARFTRFAGVLGEYVHHDGSVGVLFKATGANADRQLLRDVCMHITAVVPTPVATRRDEVPVATIAKEKEIAQAQITADPKNASKPANILEKIAEGKLNSWFKENVLVEQPFVKDDSKTVGQLLKSAGLEAVTFVRYKVGQV